MSKHQSESEMSRAADVLATEIAAIRDECQRAMQTLSRRKPLSNATLAEWVRLGDSLERTNLSLRFAVAQIAISRRKREHNDVLTS